MALSENARTWAKSAYTMATAWIGAKQGGSGKGRVAGGEKVFRGNPTDYIPHYQLPW